MLAVALAKVRSLKDDVKRLSAALIEERDRNDGLRQANAHASTVCGDAQDGIKRLKAELARVSQEYSDLTARLMHIKNRGNDEVSGLVAERDGNQMKIRALQSELSKIDLDNIFFKGAVSNLKEELAAEKHRANDLYITNQKFAEDDHEYRLEAVKAQNRLTNDNLHQADEIERLNKQVSAWINNPVNEHLEEQVKHLDAYARTLKVDFDQAMLVGQGQINTLQVDVNKRDLKIANLQQTLDRERASHTMAFITKAERIDELLIIEKNLTDRTHAAELAVDRQKDLIEFLRRDAAELDRLYNAHIQSRKQSALSKFWQWLNSDY